MADGSVDIVLKLELGHDREPPPVSAGGGIYNPRNVCPGCKAFDADAGEEIELVTSVDTNRGEIEQHARPLRLNAARTDVETERTRFRKIVTIFGEGGLPELFLCYGRIPTKVESASVFAQELARGGFLHSAVEPAPSRREAVVPVAAARRPAGTVHVGRPFRFFGPDEISAAFASCVGDEPRRDVVCPECAMPSDGVMPEDVTRAAVRRLAEAAVRRLAEHLTTSSVKPALPALTVTAGERYRTLIG